MSSNSTGYYLFLLLFIEEKIVYPQKHLVVKQLKQSILDSEEIFIFY